MSPTTELAKDYETGIGVSYFQMIGVPTMCVLRGPVVFECEMSPQTRVFKYLVPNWWDFLLFGKVVDTVGGGFSLKEVGHWGVNLKVL